MSLSLFNRPLPLRLFSRSFLWSKPVRLQTYASNAASPTPTITNTITSKELCDAILQRLAPTFDRSIPLDIVDLWPNGRLWTESFHEFLNPRRHILVDQRPTRFSLFEPLLKAPGSRYNYIQADPARAEFWGHLFSKEYLPELVGSREARPPNALNPNLLFLVNIARSRVSSEVGNTLFNRYFRSCVDGSFMHRYGAVRMILVTHQDFVDVLLPRCLSNRRRTSGLAEGVAKIVQVAGNDSTRSKIHLKGLSLANKCADQVAQREKEAGIRVPEDRVAAPLELAPVPRYQEKPSDEIVYTPRLKQPWHEEYIQLEAAYRAGKLVKQVNPNTHRRLVVLRRHLLYENRQSAIVDSALRIQSDIDKLEERIRKAKVEYESGQRGIELVAELKEILSSKNQLTEQLETVTSSMGPLCTRWLASYVDEDRCFPTDEDKTKPLLLWDRRPYEPLRVYNDDFDLQMTCTVLDIQPDPSSHVMSSFRKLQEEGKREESHATTAVWYDLCQFLKTYNKRPIDVVLRRLFPSRPISDIVKSIPALARHAKVSVSFTKGPDGIETPTFSYADDCLSHASYRTIPSSTLWDIAAAWVKWPYRSVSMNDSFKIMGGSTQISKWSDK
ncbi:hypothetical protein VTO42DRAFT_3492 [Malbranchea cinnamomea]